MAVLADGPCRASDWLDAVDTRRSLHAVTALGARSRRDGGDLTVWPGQFPLGGDRGAVPEIDCGNSGTTARLLTGLLAGLPGEVILQGDASLATRPMNRVVAPLRRMGADITFLAGHGHLPLRIRGRELIACRHELTVASAQVKSALLLAGLTARGRTVVVGAGTSRDHTERLLATMGVPIAGSGRPDAVAVTGGGGPWQPFAIAVPGDVSSAAPLLVAAALVPGSWVTVPNLSLNPTRTGVLEVLRRAGARVTVQSDGSPAWPAEPRGAVTVAAEPLRGFTVTEPEVPTLIDELPLAAVLATQATGESVVSGAAELRTKESDRIASMVAQLRLLGADIVARPDGFVVRGPTPLRAPASPTIVATAGDHRIAMALAVAALVADGETALDDPGCLAISYPTFLADLARFVGERG